MMRSSSVGGAAQQATTANSRRSRRRPRQIKQPLLLRAFVQSKVVLALSAGLLISLGIAFLAETPSLEDTLGQGISAGKNSQRQIQRATTLVINNNNNHHDYQGRNSVQGPDGDLEGSTDTSDSDKKPDYGGFTLHFFTSDFAERVIRDFSLGPGPVYLDRNRNGYTQDDDYSLKEDYIDNDEVDYDQSDCRFPKMHNMVLPTCNQFHEFPFAEKVRSGESKLVGHGEFKKVFSVVTKQEKHVLKTAILELGRGKHKKKKDKYPAGWTYDQMQEYVMDGIISAATVPHPAMVDLYGFCHLSLQSEFMDLGDMEKLVVGIDRCEKDVTLSVDTADIVVFNDLKPVQKLSYALHMAEGLALLHNNPMGVIVHDDIQLGQFLLTAGGRVKFNDFNRGVVMMYDESKHKYCKYNSNGVGPGDWRAPEEYRNDFLDEQIDIFSLANNFYSVLTGLYPMPNICHYHDVATEIKKGNRGFLDPRWKDNSYAEGQLVEIIKICWEHEPEDRPTVGELVLLLRTAMKQQQKLLLEEEAAPNSKNFLVKNSTKKNKNNSTIAGVVYAAAAKIRNTNRRKKDGEEEGGNAPDDGDVHKSKNKKR